VSRKPPQILDIPLRIWSRPGVTMLDMSIPALSRLVLVPSARTALAPAGAAPIRRYRLARVESPVRDDRDPFAHLKRVYD
jgi:hypothetical protein